MTDTSRAAMTAAQTLAEVWAMLPSDPENESYQRRTGALLGIQRLLGPWAAKDFEDADQALIRELEKALLASAKRLHYTADHAIGFEDCYSADCYETRAVLALVSSWREAVTGMALLPLSPEDELRRLRLQASVDTGAPQEKVGVVLKQAVPVMTERAFQEAVREHLLRAGWPLVYHTWSLQHSASGFPDVVALRWEPQPRLLVAELKRDRPWSRGQKTRQDYLRENSTAEQAAWLSGFARQLGLPEVYLWRPYDLEEIAHIIYGDQPPPVGGWKTAWR